MGSALSIRLRFVKYRFVRYRFVRYWFRFVSKPWLDTDIPSKHSTCLQDVFKTSGRHIFIRSSRHVFKKSWRRLQPITIFRLAKCLQHVFKMYLQNFFKMSARLLQDVLEEEKLLSWRRLEDVFKTCFEDDFKTYWRRPNVCWVSSRTESQYLLYDQRKPTFILS